MTHSSVEVRPFAKDRRVLSLDGRVLTVPDDWALLPPGDPALSRRIKEDGPSWSVLEHKGRKVFSHGIWAPAARIEALRLELEAERADPAYQRKLEASRQRRAREEQDYARDFREAVLDFLCFHHRHTALAEELATRIANHATPVGSGTVARTERIPLIDRAEAATIAWMRHQTTAYDDMDVPRVKGMRREVRRQLARRSHELLEQYRGDKDIDATRCPLQQALAKPRSGEQGAAQV